jgi:hypothetical protein
LKKRACTQYENSDQGLLKQALLPKGASIFPQNHAQDRSRNENEGQARQTTIISARSRDGML